MLRERRRARGTLNRERSIGIATGASVNAPPAVTFVTPNTGEEVGNDAITELRGTGFLAGATVKFGGVSATSVVVVSSVKITCVTPAGTGVANILVTNTDGQTSGTSGNGLFTYFFVAAPTVTSITPNSGTDAGGDSITDLHGTGFQSGATVKIGGVSATGVAFVSSAKLTCTTPAGTAGARNVVVTNPDTQTSGSSGNGLFTYISSVNPVTSSVTQTIADVLGGSSHVIAGTGFTGTTGAGGVLFGATNATSYVVDSDIQITAVAPAHTAGAANVTVVNQSVTSNAQTFTYLDPAAAATELLEKGSYTNIAGVGLWTKRVGDNATKASSAPAAASGAPDFVRADASSLTAGSWATYFGTGAFACDVIMNLDDVVYASSGAEGEGVITDANENDGVYVKFISPDYKVKFEIFNSGYKRAETNFTIGTRVHVQSRINSGNVEIRVNGGSWVVGDAVAGCNAGDGSMFIGKSAGGVRIDGRVIAIRVSQTAYNDADADKYYHWGLARFP